MQKKVLVLGAGLVGSVIATDLSRDFDVTSADLSPAALDNVQKKAGVKTQTINLSDVAALRKLIDSFDMVVSAVPGFLGYRTLQTIIEAGKNVVDIAFFPEDAFGLDELAKKHNVTAVVDCGVAPGMSNIVLGYHNELMKVETYKCYVGGLPQVRRWPYEYRAVFSPIDVIEEYTRPARYVEGGREVVREALSDIELLEFDGVGTLEAWNSDGLRSMIKTFPDVPNMIEKTMRYPGTTEYLKVLRHTGFFDYKEIEVNGVKIRPIDVTAKLLFPKWKLQPGEGDITVMRIIVEGIENGANVRYTYSLADRYDAATQTISMARTTGYTCTAAVHLLANGVFTRKGVCPPEYVGMETGNFERILAHLRQRNVIYDVKKETV